ncbi:hypothetical protein [Natronobacterium texcoconense]|uniref:Uncharacterized protein n=1 Tax=Natronobacterium texcoconense TaxID=1095778 RepID=A0A1H1BYS6_NATTX|nr:hypothetical protein [Natronobacterium texcoconense]SDQ57084.1 hypothetical protein SAMN04489842_1205 [Natronobacterium texcoconense]
MRKTLERTRAESERAVDKLADRARDRGLEDDDLLERAANADLDVESHGTFEVADDECLFHVVAFAAVVSQYRKTGEYSPDL